MLRKTAVILVLLVGLAPSQDLAAQQNPNLAEAITRYKSGDWEVSLDTLLKLEPSLLGAEQSRGRQFLAMSYFSLGRFDDAVNVFKRIVRDDPAFDMNSLAIDKEAVDVEVIRYFGQAIAEVRKQEREEFQARMARASSHSAILRSAALPGWGQLYLGHKGRGYAVIGLAAAAVTNIFISESSLRSARDDYQSAPAGSDYDALFARYNDKADRADVALGILAAVWVLNIADAAIQGPNLAPPSGLALQTGPRGQGVRAAWIKRF